MRRILLVILAALLGSIPAFSAEIALRPSARVPADRAVVLADVADLSGDEALALGQVEVRQAVGASRRASVDMREVRAALEANGVNWGKVTLRGASCELVAAAPPPAPTPAPPAEPVAAKAMAEAAPTHEVVRATDAATVRKAAAQMLARLFEVELEDLQIAFDDPASPLLATSGVGRRIEVQPAASPSTSRIPLSVWVYDGDRVLASGLVRADVLVRRPVVIAAGGLRRGQVISDGDVSAEVVWTEPSAGSPIASVEEVVGQVCRTRIPTGTALLAEHIEPALLVKRGDLVTIHCISGGVVVKAPARAQSDGRDGETIEFKMDKSKRSFLARIDGAGRAVMLTGADAGRTEAGQ